jgi:hypothetical protein
MPVSPCQDNAKKIPLVQPASGLLGANRAATDEKPSFISLMPASRGIVFWGLVNGILLVL